MSALRPSIACLFLVFVAATSANAQVSTVKGKGKALELVEISRLMAANTNDTVYSVPEGRRLVITDLVVYNTNATAIERAGLYRAGEIFVAFAIPASGTFAHSFTTGISFDAGGSVGIDNQGAGEGLYYLTGYLTKP